MRGAWILAAMAFSLPDRASPQSPPVQIEITVTAEEARQLKAAADALKAASDPFLASLSTRLPALVGAMALPRQPEKVFILGPLTRDENSFFDPRGYLSRYH